MPELQLMRHDWDALRGLAGRAGIAPERVGRLERLSNEDGAPAGAGCTLLVGSATILELLLARWLGPEAARIRSESGGRPLVMGPEPDRVQPSLGRWPTLSRDDLGPGHVLALEASGPLPAGLSSALGSLGGLDQAIIATRLGQPFPQDERRLIGSLRSLVATARALVVALPSDEISPEERDDLTAYAVAQVEGQGFGLGRCLGASIWVAGPRGDAGSADEVAGLLRVREEDVRAGRAEILRDALAELLGDLESSPEPQVAAVEVSKEDLDDAIRQFEHHLDGLGHKLRQMALRGEFADAAGVRSFFLDTLKGWNSGHSLPAASMTYVETIRPGTKFALAAEADAAAGMLDHHSSPASKTAADRPLGAAWFDRPRPIVVAVLAGLIVSGAVYLITVPLLSAWLTTLSSNVAGMLGAVLAFILSTRFRSAPSGARTSAARASAGPGEPESSPLIGWDRAAQRLKTWFAERMRDKTPTVREECRRLRKTWGISEERP